MAEKTKAELLKEELFYKPVSAGDQMTHAQFEAAEAFAVGYRAFIDRAKTEREAVEAMLELLEAKGYRPFESGKAYRAGDKLYQNVRGRALIAATVGQRSLAEGVNIVASHIDSPRLDLKPRPLYEDGQLALLKTHYYGGVKKYQWAAIPLALHGVIVKKNGEKTAVAIGEDEQDPVFTITDLLPHLGKDQMDRKLRDGIKGEELNVLAGSRPYAEDKTASERVKLRVLQLLFAKYGVTEADLLSAELMLVPAFKARDVGFDASMVGAYGHDDRVCAYTSLMAEMEGENPETTTVTVFADKEEVGSEGNTGLHSEFLRYFLADLAAEKHVSVHTLLANSRCLSADVSAAVDPTFSDVTEKQNSAYLSHGVAVMKYSGSGGKSSTNDASAEFMGYVRRIFDEAGVLWQTCELGKVDQGGGGTVAKFVANIGAEVIDVGVPVLSMHSPFEVVAKADVYQAYLAFKAFYGQTSPRGEARAEPAESRTSSINADYTQFASKKALLADAGLTLRVREYIKAFELANAFWKHKTENCLIVRYINRQTGKYQFCVLDGEKLSITDVKNAAAGRSLIASRLSPDEAAAGTGENESAADKA